ncbi:flavin reductase family protein [Streptomyces spectabilis]|uniref:flavin reductase family protein n=1 Tax=Streptomyces spectabilis TaxID=68270 RepID=UPI0013787F2F|nr:flavin reductase family protein [Streptomyces spectabilis]
MPHPPARPVPASQGLAPDLFPPLAAALPTGVCVVTSLGPSGAPAGMTSGAVCFLSREPPLTLVCMGRASRTLAAVLGHGAFCVNVLAADAAALSRRFAGQTPHRADKFAGVGWRPARDGTPVLTEGTVAHVSCELLRTVDGGDHTVVIGLAVEGAHRPDAVPLLYHRRRYAGFPP